MTDAELCARLHGLLAGRHAMVLPGAGSAMTARIIAEAGFEAIYATGAGIANTIYGVPDIGLVPQSQVVEQIAAMRQACPDLPIVADGDTGFGNAVNAWQTVRLFERAGANAIQLEDQVFPKKCGHFAGKAVIEVEEMCDKIRAACDARQCDDFLIIARTDARSVEGLDAAVERIGRYHEAGAQATFVEAPQGIDEIARIGRETPGYRVLNIVHGGKTPMPTQEQAREWGFSALLYANAALQAAIRAMGDVLGHLRAAGSLAGVEDRLAGFEERQAVVDKPRWDALERRFSPNR